MSRALTGSAIAMMKITSTGEFDDDGYERICHLDDLPKADSEGNGAKASTRLSTGRGILLFKLKASLATDLHKDSEQGDGYCWVAMDHACYRRCWQ